MNTTFMSVIGIVSLLAIALLFSKNRKAINLRTVGFAFLLQILLGALVLYIPWGKQVLLAVSNSVETVIAYGQQGTSFLFGGLADNTTFGLGLGFIFAVRVLPSIVFFSALIAVLYHLGVMQLTVRILGGALRKLLGTSKTESLSATANIFVGQTEAPMLVRPYIAKMTQSELFAVMCGGLASVAGSVIAGYAAMGVRMEYLIAASFMAAPGGLLFAKLLLPETEKTSDDADVAEEDDAQKPANVIDAAAGGAAAGLKLALNVGAMLLAFVGLIALINGTLGYLGAQFGFEGLSLSYLLGKAFAPIAFLLGIPWGEANIAGAIIGEKIVVNEFIAYSTLSDYLNGALIPETQAAMSEHARAVLSFALCGFANLSSVAILLGGLGGMAPNRRQDIARLGLLSILAGTLSNLMSASIAGLFLSL